MHCMNRIVLISCHCERQHARMSVFKGFNRIRNLLMSLFSVPRTPPQIPPAELRAAVLNLDPRAVGNEESVAALMQVQRLTYRFADEPYLPSQEQHTDHLSNLVWHVTCEHA